MQRLLWACTGVKDKAFDDTRYVMELVAPDTVNTMPEATLDAVADHAVLRGETIRPGYAAAEAVLDKLGAIGIDMEDVAKTLEEQGIASFGKSWDDLIASVMLRLEDSGADVDADGSVAPAGGDDAPTTDAPPAAGAPRTEQGAAR